MVTGDTLSEGVWHAHLILMGILIIYYIESALLRLLTTYVVGIDKIRP
mgnify:FL=1